MQHYTYIPIAPKLCYFMDADWRVTPSVSQLGCNISKLKQNYRVHIYIYIYRYIVYSYSW